MPKTKLPKQSCNRYSPRRLGASVIQCRSILDRLESKRNRAICQREMPSFKERIRMEYGEDTLTLERKYCRNKEAKALQKKKKKNNVFDLRCKSEGILPTGLRLRAPIRTPAGRRIAKKAGRRFLNEHLRMSNPWVRKIHDDLNGPILDYARCNSVLVPPA